MALGWNSRIDVENAIHRAEREARAKQEAAKREERQAVCKELVKELEKFFWENPAGLSKEWEAQKYNKALPQACIQIENRLYPIISKRRRNAWKKRFKKFYAKYGSG